MTRARRSLKYIVPVLAVVTLASACQSSDDSSSPDSATTADQTLTVLAASSLTGSFTDLASQFEDAHPGSSVALSFGSSSTLATQVIDGAPADVLATASPGSMQPVVDEGLTEGRPQLLAENSVAIAMPPDNPAGLKQLDDLANADVKVAVCVETAPCGSVANDLFDLAKIDVTPVTQEVDVKSVLAKVTTGEVDAGVVYVTDVQAAGDQVAELPVPKQYTVTTDYLVASLKDAAEPDLASEFTDFVLSPQGQQVLADAGFTVS
ncbi:MAG TPA: molybdate ABC transporter substrate-binding protein [Actinomycetes bacterium]|nr:molybdate ABC transporter substrate-binding protein [Actinomycetes bacterium]